MTRVIITCEGKLGDSHGQGHRDTLMSEHTRPLPCEVWMHFTDKETRHREARNLPKE